jgi:hypothetical protein
VLRAGNQDIRRPAGTALRRDARLGACTIPIGLAIGDLDWNPGWPHGLPAAACLELAGARLAADLDHPPRLPAALTSVLLTFQPVLSVLFAWAILDETPSALQLAGSRFVSAAC